MQETWRWFGQENPVSLDHARQAGATGIVTAPHHVQAGEPRPLDGVRRRRVRSRPLA